MTSPSSVLRGPCPHCGLYGHQGACPRIKSIEYHPNGTISRVEYHGPAAAVPVLSGPAAAAGQPEREGGDE